MTFKRSAVLRGLGKSAKDAVARHHTASNFRRSWGGALDSAAVLRGFVKTWFAGGSRPQSGMRDKASRAFKGLQDPSTLIVDMRPACEFLQGFIAGSCSAASLEVLAACGNPCSAGKEQTILIGDSSTARHRIVEKLKEQHLPAIAATLTSAAILDWERQGGGLAKVEQIGPGTLAVRIAAWKTLVIDVREASAPKLRHVPESIHIPAEELALSCCGLPLETNVTIVCENGNRSAYAAGLMWSLGYRNISVLDGGLSRYRADGFTIQNRVSKTSKP